MSLTQRPDASMSRLRHLFSFTQGFHTGSIHFQVRDFSWVPYNFFFYRGSIQVPYASRSGFVILSYSGVLYRFHTLPGQRFYLGSIQFFFLKGFHADSLRFQVGISYYLILRGSIQVPYTSRSKILVGFHTIFSL